MAIIPRVTVTVSGETGIGKSRILAEIEIALKAAGITVEFGTIDDQRAAEAEHWAISQHPAGPAVPEWPLVVLTERNEARHVQMADPLNHTTGVPDLVQEVAGLAIVSRRIRFTYKNWRGETSIRTAEPFRIWFGRTRWHPEPQWFMAATDCEKNATREFAVADMRNVRNVG